MKLRPEEITAVLKSQIRDYEAEVDVQEVGTVLQVGDGIARIHGLENAVASEMLELPTGLWGWSSTSRKITWAPCSWARIP